MGPTSRMFDLPACPILRPGCRVTRRDDGHLQVGIDPPYRVVLDDVVEVREILADLRHGHTPTARSDLGSAAIASLLRADLVVNHHPAVLRSAQFGDSVASRIDRIRQARVAVTAATNCSIWAAEVSALLMQEGVRTVPSPHTADLIVVLASGEPALDALDDLLRGDAPFLLVVSRARGVEIGPFVEPGQGACHRCVDAHRGELDPRRSLIVEQIRQHLEEFDDEPMDPLLVRWASTWAVRDVCRRLEGDSPSTYSASYVVGPVGPPEAFTWTRHPHCGCSWATALDQVHG